MTANLFLPSLEMSMFTLALLLTTASPASPCESALRVAPGLACAAAGRGVALATAPEEAERLAAYARAGEARFDVQFGQPIAPYAVVLTPPAPDNAALRSAGFTHILPWPAPRAFDEAARRGLELGARRFAASQNMSAAQTEEVVARALSQIPDATSQAALDAGMVPHELGHLWFTAAFWPDRSPPVGEAPRHYGGPGPDWLDEAAAIVMEDEPTAAMRRDQCRTLMRGETVPAIGPVEARGTLLDLPGLLAREHPGLTRALTTAPEVIPPGGGVGVTFTPAGAGVRPAAQERLFYIQTRVFADYLMQRSGNPAILADIAQALAGDGDFGGWLSSEGARHNLPSSISALQADWESFTSNLR